MRLRRQGSIEPLLTLPIETPRLILRDFVSRDLEAVHAYSSLPDVSRYLVWGPNTLLQSKDMIRGFLLDQKRRPRINFDLAIVRKGSARRGDGPKLIGGAGLKLADWENRTGDIGYVLHPCAGRAPSALANIFRASGAMSFSTPFSPRNSWARRPLQVAHGFGREVAVRFVNALAAPDQKFDPGAPVAHLHKLVACLRAEMRHVDPGYGIAGKYPQEGARLQAEKALSRAQDRHRTFLADHVEQNFCVFIHSAWCPRGFRPLAKTAA